MSRRPPSLPILGLAVWALTGACSEPQVLPPASGPPAETPTPFRDHHDLLAAIQQGSFAKRAGLEDELATLVVPDPVRIAFVSGTRVPEEEEPKLARLAAAIASDGRLRVDLTGCSDPPGSEALNLRISRSRAESVARRLVELGLPEDRLGEVAGRGEDCPQPAREVRIEPRMADGAA